MKQQSKYMNDRWRPSSARARSGMDISLAFCPEPFDSSTPQERASGLLPLSIHPLAWLHSTSPYSLAEATVRMSSSTSRITATDTGLPAPS